MKISASMAQPLWLAPVALTSALRFRFNWYPGQCRSSLDELLAAACLSVKLHAQRSIHRLRDFGNRGGRLVADLVGVDDRHPRHQDHHGLAVIALLGPGDELVAPAHDLADVGVAPASAKAAQQLRTSRCRCTP